MNLERLDPNVAGALDTPCACCKHLWSEFKETSDATAFFRVEIPWSAYLSGVEGTLGDLTLCGLCLNTIRAVMSQDVWPQANGRLQKLVTELEAVLHSYQEQQREQT